MTTPERCDQDVYENGETALMATLGSKRMEPWVVKVRSRSGQRVDWHYAAGRAFVKFIGDEMAVRNAIVAESQSMVDLYLEEMTEHQCPPGHRGAQVAMGYGLVPDIRLPLGDRHTILSLADIDEESGEVEYGPRYATLDDVVRDNPGDDDLVERARTLGVGETADFGGGAAALTRITRIS